MNSITRNSLYSFVLQVSTQTVLLILNLLIARNISIIEYGNYIFGFSLAIFISSFFAGVSTLLLAKSYGKDQDKVKLREYLNYFIILGVCLAIIILLIAKAISTDLWTIAFLLVFPTLLSSLISSYYIATEKVIFANIQQLVFRVILLFSFGLYFILYKNIIAYIYIGVLLSSIYVLYLLFVKQTIHLKASKPKDDSLGFVFLALSSTLASYIGIFVLKIFEGNYSVVIFSLAAQMTGGVSLVLSVISANIMTRVSRTYHNDTSINFKTTVRQCGNLVFGFSSVIILLSIFGGYLLVKLYGDSFQSAFYIFLTLVIGNIFHVANGDNGMICNMTGRHKYVTFAMLVAILINIIIGSILVILIGIYGMAIAASFSLIIWNIILTYVCIIKIGVNPTIFRYLDRFQKA